MVKKPDKKNANAKKRTAKTAAAETENESAKPTHAAQLIGASALKGLLRAKKATQAEVDETLGSYRSKLAYAVEKQHLHKKAYATLVQMDRMEPEKLAEYFDTLQAYMDMAGITKRIESVGRLPLADSRDGEDDDNTDEQPAAAAAPNVARPDFGSGRGDAHVADQVKDIASNAGASPRPAAG